MCRVDGLQQANSGELPPSGGPSAHTFWRISLSSSSSNSAKAGLFSFARAFPSFHAKKQIYGTGFMMETLLNVNVVKGVLGALGPSVLTVLTLTSRCFSVLESSSTRNNSPRRPVCPVKARLVDGAWQGLWRVGFCRTDCTDRGSSMYQAGMWPPTETLLEDMVETRLRQRYSIEDTSAGAE